MFRANGGLIGSRRTPTISAAPGVWSLAEQVMWARTSNWPGQNPIPGLNPLLWYDFADETSVTVSSSTITSVTDKGSRAWNLSKSTTGPSYATGINGLKCCDWGSPGHGNYLRNTSSTSTSIAEVYIVMDGNFGSGFNDYYGLVTGTASNSFYITSVGANPFTGLAEFNGLDQAFVNNGATSTFNTVLPAINSPSLVRLRKSGGGSLTTTSGIQFGQERTSTNRGWGGLMGEIIAFSSVLGDSDRNTMQTYLATKWGLTLS